MKVLRVRPKHYPEVIDIDCWNGSMSTTMIFAANSTSVMRLLITSRTTTGTTIR